MREIYNVMEEIVPTLVKVMMHSPSYQTYCHCEHCIKDISALTLNTIKPRYVTSSDKRTLIIQLYKNDYMIEALNKHIIHAIHVVGQNPNHEAELS